MAHCTPGWAGILCAGATSDCCPIQTWCPRPSQDCYYRGQRWITKINENITAKRWNWMFVNTQNTTNICLSCLSTIRNNHISMSNLYYCWFLSHPRTTATAWIIQQGFNKSNQADRKHVVGGLQQLAWMLKVRGMSLLPDLPTPTLVCSLICF